GCVRDGGEMKKRDIVSGASTNPPHPCPSPPRGEGIECLRPLGECKGARRVEPLSPRGRGAGVRGLPAPLAISLLGLVPIGPLPGRAAGAEKFLTAQKGGLPVTLSAPHGGRKPIPGVPERQGDGVKQFVTGRDENTAELAELLAAALEKQIGARPFLV